MNDADRAEEALGLAGDDDARRHQEKQIDGDEDDEHPVPLEMDPVVLQRDAEIGPEEDQAAGVLFLRELEELAEGEEADQAEKPEAALFAEQERDAEEDNDRPPRLDAQDKFTAVAIGLLDAQQGHDQRGNDEEREDG